MVDNCSTEDTHNHKGSNCMDIHTDSYKDNKAGIKHSQESCQPSLLEKAPLLQIQTRHAVCQNGGTYYQNEPFISPFLTYPIREGLSEEGRMPMNRINNAWS